LQIVLSSKGFGYDVWKCSWHNSTWTVAADQRVSRQFIPIKHQCFQL
jgi:hypothetical protein